MTTVWIKTSFIGFHCWPAAPVSQKYLRDLHRHVFGVKVTCWVGHPDRAVEFHDLKASTDIVIAQDLTVNLRNCASMSCEMIATHIGNILRTGHNFSVLAVEVDEDGECGARVTFDI